MTEAKPRLLLQHSRPDHEVSKLSSDSYRSLTNLEHAAVNGDSPSILASSWDPPPGWLCPSEFELAMAAIETSIQNCLKVSQLWFVAVCAAA